MKIHNFRGELTGISAKKEALIVLRQHEAQTVIAGELLSELSKGWAVV